MKSRWIATIVCLLYLSVSTVFAALHHHENDSIQGDQKCAACAWHHEGQVDLPSVATSAQQPLTVIWRQQPANSFLRELSLKIHPSRGPPSFSL